MLINGKLAKMNMVSTAVRSQMTEGGGQKAASDFRIQSYFICILLIPVADSPVHRHRVPLFLFAPYL
jgi:hypothetical protein